jgi:hypothetical protein
MSSDAQKGTTTFGLGSLCSAPSVSIE